jgi:hypothetical protein
MNRLETWIGALIERWLSGFKRRYGLASELPKPIVDRGQKLLLHVGCGPANISNIPVRGFQEPEWRELRLDLDASVHPDIEGSMTHMPAVPAGLVDAIYSSHSIEHLVWHEVPRALDEFQRVLKDTGFVVITCPDVQSLAAMVAEDRLLETLYESFAGPVTTFDILYGYRPVLEKNPWMAHRSGFTFSTLVDVLRAAKFPSIAGFRRPDAFDLWVVASKSKRTEEEMRNLASTYLINAA